MRVICAGNLLAVVLSLGVSSACSAEPPQRERELDWVKQLAAEFFELVLAAESERDYATSITAFLSSELSARLKEQPPEATIPKMAWQYREGTFKLRSAEMAPNGSEVIIVGELTPSTARTDPAKTKEDETARHIAKVLTGVDLGERQVKPAGVTLRVAKDSEGGRWLIRFVRVKLKASEKEKQAHRTFWLTAHAESFAG